MVIEELRSRMMMIMRMITMMKLTTTPFGFVTFEETIGGKNGQIKHGH